MIRAFAPGKIILSGEYAVVFGYPGIAVPTQMGVEVTWEETGDTPLKIILEGMEEGEQYPRKIVDLCSSKGGRATGTLTIRNQIPVGRGMGSSTALVISICRCLLGEDTRAQALLVEDLINPGNSGLDFAVIWANRPVMFRKGSAPQPVKINLDFMKTAALIDTGKPGETTAALVVWMTSKVSREHVLSADTTAALKTIGRCTERLFAGENPLAVIRDHHRAQMTLGVVTAEAQKIIAEFEQKGGAAKVLGAGARTGGGGGMILTLT